jgi:hypothetical protein
MFNVSLPLGLADEQVSHTYEGFLDISLSLKSDNAKPRKVSYVSRVQCVKAHNFSETVSRQWPTNSFLAKARRPRINPSLLPRRIPR